MKTTRRLQWPTLSWRLLSGLWLASATVVFLVFAPFANAENARNAKNHNSSPATGITIGRGNASLPVAVAEMRDAILAAARTGELKELLIPIQWNELPPDFGDRSIEATLDHWRKESPDGTGREWLALLINLLEAPYGAVQRGRDIENPKIYIWPAFAEIPLDKLSPTLEVELLRLVSPAEALRMKKRGKYDGFGIAIGADGTWHAFKQTASPQK